LPTTFNDGAPVLFTDDALGTTTVDLVATVKPLSVTVTNVLLPYTIVGVGKISGATGLLKQGTNTLTIANTGLNDYIGRTVISGGTLAVTNLANGGSPSALGKSSANATNLVLSGGTLRYAGTPVSIDRGYTVQGAIGVIDAQSDLTLSGRPVAGPDGGLRKTGAAKLTYTGGGINELSGGGWPGFNVALGTVVFDGSAGAQTNHSHNDCWIGGGVDGNCALVLTNTTLNEDNWVVVARGNGTVGNTSSLTLYDSVLRSGAFSMGFDGGISGNLAQQFTTLNGTSAITNNGDMNLGESGGSSSSMQLNGSSALYSGGRIMVGWHNNATGSVTLANSSKLVINAWLSVGNEGGIGTFTMKNDSSCWVRLDMNVTDVDAGDATLTMQDNAQMTAGALFVAKGAGSTGTATIKDNVRITANNLYVANATGANGIVNQTGGTVTTAGNEFQIGARSAGTYNMSGGVVNSDANWTSIGRYTGSVGELNLSGGVFNHNDAGRIVQVGEEGLGTLNLSGTGILNAAGDRLQIASAVGSAGYVNLNGGTLVARRIASGAGSSTFTFNGGTLRAAPNAHADFMSGLTLATVVAGGAVIDTSTNNIAIVQDLVGDGSGGGLTKLGTGGLALMGVNTYNGLTLVSTGTLGGNGTIAGPVTVSAGAGLAPGTSIGTLTINNPLTLAAGSTTTMDLNKTLGTNDMVAGLATVSYGGTLVLKNLAGQLAVGDTFTLFNTGVRTGAFTNYVSDTPGQVVTWNTDKLQLDGTVKVLTAVALPVKLTSVVIGGNLNLSWPLSQIGWELQTQANPLTVGLSTNWSAVAGSTATNQMSFPINPASGSTFFRLLFP
jgi:autotransporter-associated beta strand protein